MSKDVIPAGKLGVSEKYVPEGWESREKFLEYVVKTYDADVTYDNKNREWALEDLKFVAGDQWDPEAKAQREAQLRPCLTINVLPQFIGQVIGDRRMNRVAIKVRPFRDGTKEIADARSGLIKSIELFSRAERVYDATCEDQVACGIGNMRVDLDYAANDVFEQDIFIRHIPNPLAVVWDRMSVDPTGRDARHCFVTDTMPREVFEKQYPDSEIPSAISDSARTAAGWFDSNTVRITEFWEMVDKPAILMLAADGDVKDITGMTEDQWIQDAWVDPRTGKPRIRKSVRTYARMHLVSGFDILSEAYELPLSRLPIIRAEGRVVRVGEDRVRFGLTRFAKDSQRLKNYWRSVAAEALALAPKAQWIADSGAVEGREKQFRDSALTGDPLLIYNKGTDKPDRVDPPAVPAALLQEAALNQQDIKDTTGLHDASLGIRSNEVSGKAIDARKAEGDVATIVYHDNLNHAILEAGDVINQLIPLAYDSMRVVRIIGDDDKHNLVTINDPNDENSPDIARGKYDVVLDTGPSFLTQRMEAQAGMRELLQTSPELMGVIGDIVAKGMDWPLSHEIAERIKKTIPPQLLDEEDQAEMQQPQEPSQEEQAAAQMQQMQLADAEAQLQHAEELRQAELVQAQAAARKAVYDADIAAENARKAKADADAAEEKAAMASIEASYAPDKHEQGLRHADEKHDMALVQGDESHSAAMDAEEDRRETAAAQAGQGMEHAQEKHERGMEMADSAAADKQRPLHPGAKTGKGADQKDKSS